MGRFGRYLNPISQLGKRKYSYLFPFFTTLAVCVASELFAYHVAHNPLIVGVYIIYVTVLLMIYFAFRDGIRGGVTTTVVTISYFGYIIYTRHFKGQQLTSGIETSAVLGVIYLIVGVIIGWLKQTIDKLIEREANEKRRLQAIVEQLPVGVLITDEHGKIVQANKQVTTILGREPMLGTVAGEATINNAYYNDKPITPSQWPLAQTFVTGKAVPWKDVVVDREDGKRLYLQVSANLIHNREGKIIAAASIINDITHQKEIEKRKDDFVNMASHELKTPITSMKLYVESLLNKVRKGTDGQRLLKTLESIKGQTERLQGLVNDLLDVSRLQTGKLSLSKETFNLHQLMLATIEELQGTTRKQEIIYTNTTPYYVFGDKFRIYQVINNLITNASKYSPEGTKITVKLKKSEGKVVVSVADQGIGIAKDQQKKVFDRLYQVADSDINTFPGLGMGLYIAKEIIKRHKGTIWVESEKGKGAVFLFTLPLVQKTLRE